MQYENSTDGLWCPNCGTSMSGFDAALMASKLREPYLRKKGMADYGWTRPAPQPEQVVTVVCRCGQRNDIVPMEPGDWMLLPCGLEFLRCDPAGYYVLLTEPPEDAA